MFLPCSNLGCACAGSTRQTKCWQLLFLPHECICTKHVDSRRSIVISASTNGWRLCTPTHTSYFGGLWTTRTQIVHVHRVRMLCNENAARLWMQITTRSCNNSFSGRGTYTHAANWRLLHSLYLWNVTNDLLFAVLSFDLSSSSSCDLDRGAWHLPNPTDHTQSQCWRCCGRLAICIRIAIRFAVSSRLLDSSASRSSALHVHLPQCFSAQTWHLSFFFVQSDAARIHQKSPAILVRLGSNRSLN